MEAGRGSFAVLCHAQQMKHFKTYISNALGIKYPAATQNQLNAIHTLKLQIRLIAKKVQ